jgi:thiamine-phosphate pyrophosphorylase
MCLTQDNLPWSHVEQAKRLCGAGAKWIQLRMKNAEPQAWRATASQVLAVCRDHGAVCIINDSVDVALAVGADGVHLGKSDESWREARERLWPDRILGGTINNAEDAARALEADCLDYVGVGPWRFTTNKQNLAPMLGAEGVRPLVAQLDGLPAWAIGGIEANDLPAVRLTGATGAAVSSALFRDGNLEKNYRALLTAWGPPVKEFRS